MIYSGGDFTEAAVLEIGGSKGTEVIRLGEEATIEDTVSAVNTLTDATGVAARVIDGTTLAGNTSLTLGTDIGVEVALSEAGRKLVDSGGLSIEIVDPTTTTSSTTGSLIDNGDGTFTAQITLEDSDGSTITATAAEVVAALNGVKDSSGNTLFDTQLDGETAGADTVTAGVADTDLDVGLLKIDDVRGPNQRGGATFAVADPGGTADQDFELTVTGDAVSIQLATDADGVVTSTLTDISDALEDSGLTLSDGTSLSEAFNVSVEGDGDQLADILTTSSLNETNGTSVALESADYGSAQNVTVNVLEGSFATTGSDFATESRRDSGEDVVATINGQQAVGRGLKASINTSNLTASLTFDAASNNKDESVAIDVTGGGAVFQIGQDVSISGQVGIGIDAVNTARLGGSGGKLYELTSGGGKSLSDVSNGTASGADLVDILDGAINDVSSLRGRIGAVQKNVIDTNINTLGVALENISEARSQIVDTDFAVESANLQKAQILGQAATSVLSIANQSPQRALSLLG